MGDVTKPQPLAYPPEAILSPSETAAWLQVSVKTLETLPIKRTRLGERTVRYLGKHVLEYLDQRAA